MNKIYTVSIRAHKSRCFVAHFEITGNYEGWNFNCGNYLFTTDTK